MDFLFRLNDYLADNIENIPPISPGMLSSTASSVALRETPGSVGTRYGDKGTVKEIGIQVLVKDPNFTTSHNICHAIEKELDGLPNDSIKSSNGSFIFVKCEVYVTTNWVEKSSNGEWIHTAMFIAELEQ